MQFHSDQIVSSLADIYQSNENQVYTCNTVPDIKMQVAFLHKKQDIGPTENPITHLFSNLVRKCSRCFLMGRNRWGLDKEPTPLKTTTHVDPQLHLM